jgi:hypothetical protein
MRTASGHGKTLSKSMPSPQKTNQKTDTGPSIPILLSRTLEGATRRTSTVGEKRFVDSVLALYVRLIINAVFGGCFGLAATPMPRL